MALELDKLLLTNRINFMPPAEEDEDGDGIGDAFDT